jgi:26S proteasome regulatory subunit N7
MSAQQTTPQDPQLRVAELRHLCDQPRDLVTQDEYDAAFAEALSIVKEHNMVEYYKVLAPAAQQDKALIAEMEAKNKVVLEGFKTKEEDAVANAGDTEVLEIQLKRAAHLARTASKKDALESYEACFKKAVGGAARIDVVMAMLRCAIAHGDDVPQISALLRRCSELVEKEGDWERRNRLGVYKAVVAIWERDFGAAAKLLVDSVPTFTCTELISFETLVLLTVVTATVQLDRVSLKQKVIDAPDIIQTIGEIPGLRGFLHALHECKYSVFFKGLLDLAALCKRDRFLAVHVEYVLKEARLVGYTQFLRSYQSVTLQSMATLFGVSVTFIDAELARFVAANRLTCKIDAVDGVVEMLHPDKKTAQYQTMIKDGDAVLNRVQKLAQKLKST